MSLAWPARACLSPQNRRELAHAKIFEGKDPDGSNRHLLASLPVPYRIKREWLDASDVRDTGSVEKSLTRFLGTGWATEIEIFPQASPKTRAFGDATAAQITWLYHLQRRSQVKCLWQNTRRIPLGRRFFSLRPLSMSAARHILRVLAECLIRFVVVESWRRPGWRASASG
ncbi:MAG: hypothetical protein M2R45_03537 [Verrucomicrobia subdivision 3 bacterium]|nr:hypothetical protein [Limisphaerales bacterium]MCS1416486.1 hypothetical protein [Limisphaerales bacterium]